MASLQRYLFDGSHRSRPQDKDELMEQDNREAFLERVKLDRERRALERQRNAAATKMQAWCRSFVSRQRVKNMVRRAFDKQMNGVKEGDLAATDVLVVQTKRLVFFFDAGADGDRLKWLCKQLLRRRDEVTTGAVFRRAVVTKLLQSCVVYLARIARNPGAVFAPILRSIQVFGIRQDDTTGEKLHAVLEAGYLSAVLSLFESRVPLPPPEFARISAQLPSPLAEGLFEALVAPLRIVGPLQLRRYCLFRFCNDVLSASTGVAVSHCVYHIVPAVADLFTTGRLLIDDLLETLLPDDWREKLDSGANITDFTLRDQLKTTPYLLYSLLVIADSFSLEATSLDTRVKLLWCVSRLTPSLVAICATAQLSVAELDGGEDDDAEVTSPDARTPSCIPGSSEFLVQRCVSTLESAKFVNASVGVALALNTSTSVRLVSALCYSVFRLRTKNRFSTPLLYPLSFRDKFLRGLWSMVNTCRVEGQQSLFGQLVSPFDKLQRGERPSAAERNEVFPLVSVFSALLTNVMFAVQDREFYAEDRLKPLTSMVPFSNAELRRVSERMRNVALGLIDLAYPESRFDLGSRTVVTSERLPDSHEWADLLEQVFRVVQSLHERDSRIGFCAEGMWSNHKRQPIVDREMSKSFATSRRLERRRGPTAFGFVRWMTHEDVEAEGGVGPTPTELRNVAILRRVPFVVPFLQRVDILRTMIDRDRQENGREMDHFGGAGGQNLLVIHVRRTHIYEDSYTALSPQSAPNLKLNLRVSMSNWAGAEEAGVDGGGIFREFISELLKAGFDPNRGLFMATKYSNQIYPNPSADMIEPDWDKHFFFLGRMLGKLIYEHQLAELHFASFFLAKLLHRNAATVDVHHLKSLDDVLYKNLVQLQASMDSQDVDNLEIDFSILVEKFGGTCEKVDLKPDGRNIRVTMDNRLEYVHLVADFYLNKQLDKYTRWFRHGLSQVVDLDWLAMFDRREIQTLVAGADADIDLHDMRMHTSYSGGLSDGNEAIERFWRVVAGLKPDEKRLLLKFITGCSRPPLMGFKDLFPQLAIQVIAEQDRLPTAATCMNLLKLPAFRDDATLAAKLRYAINSGAGFELS